MRNEWPAVSRAVRSSHARQLGPRMRVTGRRPNEIGSAGDVSARRHGPSDRVVARNRSISSRNRAHAGSCSNSKWFELSSGTNRLCGIRAASWRPSSNGHTRSPRQCSTMVGTVIWSARSRTSRRKNASRNRAALAGDVLLRCNSSNAAHSAGVPSGMNDDVNICRNAGLRSPHPTRARSIRTCAWARCRSGDDAVSGPRAYEP